MSEIKWIKITTDIFDDEKISIIDGLPDRDVIIVIWIKLLTLAGKLNTSGVLAISKDIVYTDVMLAQAFHRPLETVQMALEIFEKFGMIEKIDGVVTLPNWEKHQNIDGMEKIKEQNRKRVARHREKQKSLAQNNESNVTCNVTSNVTVTPNVTQCNATEQEQEQEKEEDTCSSSSSLSSEKDIYEKFEDEFQKKLTPSEMKSIDRLVFTYGTDMVEEALDESVLKGKPKLGYITGILKNWSSSKVTTLGDRLAEKENQQLNAVKRPRQSKASREEEEERRMREKWGF
nr:MAG TPA_asm: replisome organizer [Caudoviricetes sp.]